MAHDVFICHAKEDRDRAQEIRDSLEARGTRCWIAPRDVPPGVPYAEAIIQAMSGSGVVVLVFSSSANASPHVLREVECAANNDIPIIPFRVEDLPPSGAMQYFIESLQWLDAFPPPLAGHLKRLCEAVDGLLKGEVTTAPPPAGPVIQDTSGLPRPLPPKPAMVLRNPRLRLLVGGVVALVAVAFATYGVLSRGGPDKPEPPVTPPVTASGLEPSPEPNYAFVLKWGSKGSGDGEFELPRGVATDPYGNVYVTDTRNHRIEKFDRDGTLLAKWGSEGSGDGEFEFPHGVATDEDGNVYVTDSGNNRIQKLKRDGTFLTKWGSKGSRDGKFSSPFGVATDADGNVYVADIGNKRIQKFDRDGTFLTKWGSGGSGDLQFARPMGVATDADGNVYVTDAENNRIQKFDRDGGFAAKWGRKGIGDGQFSYPVGVATDADGNVYVTDAWNHRVQKFDRDGTFLTKWGAEGSRDREFKSPSEVATDADGNVYVIDTWNYRVQKFARQ